MKNPNAIIELRHLFNLLDNQLIKMRQDYDMIEERRNRVFNCLNDLESNIEE